MPNEEASSFRWVGGWLDLRAGSDVVAKGYVGASVGNRTPVVRHFPDLAHLILLLAGFVQCGTLRDIECSLMNA
jgi:hypothetical protein